MGSDATSGKTEEENEAETQDTDEKEYLWLLLKNGHMGIGNFIEPSTKL